MHVLRDELKNIQVRISSDYSPDLAEALVRGRLDVAFLRVEPTFDLCYEVVDHEPLIVLMPSDHRLTSREAIHPREFVGEIFIGGSNKATVLRAVTEDYLCRCGLDIKLDHGVDNMAMAMSLVASTRGLALMPAYAKNLLPWSVVSRPLEGEAPTIDLAVGLQQLNHLADSRPVPFAPRTAEEEERAATPFDPGGVVTSLKGEHENCTPRTLSSDSNCLAPYVHRLRSKDAVGLASGVAKQPRQLRGLRCQSASVVLRKVYREAVEIGEGAVSQSSLMSGAQDHRRRLVRLERFLPARRT
jgi:hypothetical protein